MTLFVLFAAFYFQYVLGMQPCPLCLMQRFCVFFLLLLCLMGPFLFTLKRARLVAVFQIIGSTAGLFFASRQLWLQSLPVGQAPACVPDLDVLLRYFPWKDVLHALFWGAGDCAEASWNWLGLSMAAWSVLYFLLVFIVSGVVFFLLRRSLTRIDG
jgi:disulfide bond formation protein DsbB